MEGKIDLLLFDKLNNLIEEVNIEKPKTYNDLINIIKDKFKKLPNKYDIFYQSENKNEIINNNEKYKLSKDILFIKEINDIESLEKSLFSINYELLSESKQEMFDEKFSCTICEESIKKALDGNPLLCYQCQNIFHKKCLEDWNNKCITQEKIFNCPKCKYELPLINWKEKVNYEEERNYEIDLIAKLNKNNLSNSNMNKKQLIDLEKKYNEYIEDIRRIFKDIINKINEINSLIDDDNKLSDIINRKINNPIEISNKIIENLNNIEDFIKNYVNIQKKKKTRNNKNRYKKNKDNYIISELEVKYERQENRIINSYEEYFRSNNYIKDEFKNENEIKDNIEITINDIPTPFSYFYNAEKIGKYIIKYKFKNPLKNTNYMFALCKNLTNVNLSNFNTKYVTNMSNMFLRCESLRDINLSNIDAGNVTIMKNMFCNCESLKNIENLSVLNTKNVIDMSRMFFNCQSLTYINLSNFNTKKVTNMNYMFYGCKNLNKLDLSFNTQKVTNMSSMFEGCESLTKINLSNFNTQNVIDMSNMFYNCKSLSSIDLSNFIIQDKTNITSIFGGCSSLSKNKVKSENNRILLLFH